MELQSDNDWQALSEILRQKSAMRVLNGVEAADVFRVLRAEGYSIHMPKPIVSVTGPAAGPYMICQSRKKKPK